MAKKITQKEVQTVIFDRLLFWIAFVFIAFWLKDWIEEMFNGIFFGIPLTVWIGIAILIWYLYNNDVRPPYWLKGRSR